MRLENATAVPALLVSAPMHGMTDVPAFIIAKETYDLSATGVLTEAAERLPISAEPVATPFGTFHGEIFPRKDRADFAVLGTVRLASARNQTMVTARLGQFTSQIRVVGDRVWMSRGKGELVPSAPHGFAEMPIAYTRTFGGRSPGPMGEVAWPHNPDGCGFYQTADEALGKNLPNIEWANLPTIRSWQERPDPAGWGPYPMFWGLRAVSAVLLDRDKNATGISRKAFNHAHPAMVVDAIAVGDHVDIEGMRQQRIAFDVPRLPLALHWTCGNDGGVVALAIDGLYVWVDQQKVVVTHRARFRYPFRLGEVRFARLTKEVA
jgi:hypothetical protein